MTDKEMLERQIDRMAEKIEHLKFQLKSCGFYECPDCGEMVPDNKGYWNWREECCEDCAKERRAA